MLLKADNYKCLFFKYLLCSINIYFCYTYSMFNSIIISLSSSMLMSPSMPIDVYYLYDVYQKDSTSCPHPESEGSIIQLHYSLSKNWKRSRPPVDYELGLLLRLVLE